MARGFKWILSFTRWESLACLETLCHISFGSQLVFVLIHEHKLSQGRIERCRSLLGAQSRSVWSPVDGTRGGVCTQFHPNGFLDSPRGLPC